MTKSAIAVGIVLVLFGIWLLFKISFGEEVLWWLYIYPIVIIILGMVMIVYWKAEDIIEGRKDLGGK